MHRISRLALSIILSSVPALVVFTACAGDDPKGGDNIVFVDQNGDGITDGVDTDGDGHAEYHLDCPACTPNTSPVCADPLVDTNGDGLPDGLDMNCDGTLDIPFTLPGTGSGGGSGSGSGGTGGGGTGGGGTGGGGGGGAVSCSVAVVNNSVSEAITCTTYDGVTSSCLCSASGQQPTTCTSTSSSPCSIPGGNCCGF